MSMGNIISFIILFTISACFGKPTLTITDEYIEVVKPGQSLGLVEIVPKEIDSVMGYPIKEISISSFEIIKRDNKKPLRGNDRAKIYFGKFNSNYLWRVNKNSALADYDEADIVSLKSFTWYRLSSENYKYDVYFYSKGEKGNFSVTLKPNSGPF